MALYPGVISEIVADYLAQGVGIIQLPCPEFLFGGLKRWGQCRDQYDHPAYRKHCRELLHPYVEQITTYLKEGCTIREIVGIDGSPSCGVHKTCVGFIGGETSCPGIVEGQRERLRYIEAPGIFFEELQMLLHDEAIKCTFRAIDESSAGEQANRQ